MGGSGYRYALRMHTGLPCKKGIKTRASRRFFSIHRHGCPADLLSIYEPLRCAACIRANFGVQLSRYDVTWRGSVETAGFISYCFSSALLHHLLGGAFFIVYFPVINMTETFLFHLFCTEKSLAYLLLSYLTPNGDTLSLPIWLACYVDRLIELKPRNSTHQ